MKFSKVKRLVSIIMVATHLATFAWVITLHLIGGFAFDELTTVLGLMLPLFAVFTTMIVKDAISETTLNSETKTLEKLPWGYCFLTLTFVSCLATFIIVIISLKGFNLGFATFDHFKTVLGMSEGVFGIYLGHLLPVLFGETQALDSQD